MCPAVGMWSDGQRLRHDCDSHGGNASVRSGHNMLFCCGFLRLLLLQGLVRSIDQKLIIPSEVFALGIIGFRRHAIPPIGHLLQRGSGPIIAGFLCCIQLADLPLREPGADGGQGFGPVTPVILVFLWCASVFAKYPTSMERLAAGRMRQRPACPEMLWRMLLSEIQAE